MVQLTCPQFSELDPELLQDFYGSCQEALEEISACREALAENASDKELLHRLFRAVHSLKGNCNMMFLPPFVDVTHKLEEIFDDVRKDRYPYDPAISAFAQAALSDIDEQLRILIAKKYCDGDVLEKVGKLISPIRDAASQQERVQLARVATSAILDRHYSLDVVKSATPTAHPPSAAVEMSAETYANDLEFMSEIGSALEARDVTWRGRIARQLELAKLVNKVLPQPVDDAQLTAAIFVHDVCLPWLPSALHKPWTTMSDDERHQAIVHVSWAAGILQRWPAWREAALIIEQHHEAFDGRGAPRGLAGDTIHIGAQLVALADVFFDAVAARREQPYKACLLGAVKDVNAASGQLLGSALVEAFNAVIRQHYLAHPRW
jgi:response regulator RpfG family c-di-GMP phosphodiesterase